VRARPYRRGLQLAPGLPDRQYWALKHGMANTDVGSRTFPYYRRPCRNRKPIRLQVNVEFPEAFLKKWLQATNPNLSATEIEEGFADFVNNLKWTIIENRIVTANNLEVKYEEVIDLAKERIYAQIKMYNINEEPTDEQLSQFAMQLLSDREQANRLFEEVKALKVFDHLKGAVKIKSEDIDFDKFEKLEK